jgi:transcriptional regulator
MSRAETRRRRETSWVAGALPSGKPPSSADSLTISTAFHSKPSWGDCFAPYESMHVPSSFKVSDLAELHTHIRSHSFATLVTHGEKGIEATHLPLLLDADHGPYGRLVGHMAKANKQWRATTEESLAIFAGPHAYISASWYETPGTVPTWNYATVHAYGRLRVIEDGETVHNLLRRTAATYEQNNPIQWSYDASDPVFDDMLKEITAFEIEISRLEGKYKLNQNHPEARRQKVINALENKADENSLGVAKLMRRFAGSVKE